jgi:hypothetical protein
MENAQTFTPHPETAAPDFVPVPLKRIRHDGWTPERQMRFIEVLSVTGQVSAACRAVGISRKSAYKLLDHPEAESFAAAWQAALTSGRQRMLDQLMARAINGVTTIMVKAGGAVQVEHGPDGRLMAGFLKSPAPGENRFTGGCDPKGDIR